MDSFGELSVGEYIAAGESGRGSGDGSEGHMELLCSVRLGTPPKCATLVAGCHCLASPPSVVLVPEFGTALSTWPEYMLCVCKKQMLVFSGRTRTFTGKLTVTSGPTWYG